MGTPCLPAMNEFVNELIKSCNSFEAYSVFLSDSNYIHPEEFDTFKKCAKDLMHKQHIDEYFDNRNRLVEYWEINRYINKYFFDTLKMMKDTIVEGYFRLYRELKYLDGSDSARFIHLKGREGRDLVIILAKDKEKWKLFEMSNLMHPEIRFTESELRQNLKLIDDLILMPELIYSYKISGKYPVKMTSFRLDTSMYKNNVFSKVIEYIRHNYSKGYKCNLSKCFYFKSGGGYFLDCYGTNVIISDSNDKRLLKIEFIYNDSLNEFQLGDISFCTDYFNGEVKDTLTDAELAANRDLFNRILNNPDELRTIINDSSVSAFDFRLKESYHNGYQEKIIKYISEYFSGNYTIIRDESGQDTNPHIVGQDFHSFHSIEIKSKSNDKKLFFYFRDATGNNKLYEFKLNGIYSFNTEIDGIEFKNIIIDTP